MSSTFRGTFIIAIAAIFFSNITNAQPRKGEFIHASIGYGMSAPYEDYDIIGTGFYAQAEYIFAFKKWLGVRPYAGFITTSPNENTSEPSLSGYKVTSKAFLIGGKARICAPIPWVAPYFEIGIGASVGSFETHTPSIYKKDSGLLMHIPYTLGLALGKNHDVEIAITYYEHPSVEQFSAALAIGFSFPLD